MCTADGAKALELTISSLRRQAEWHEAASASAKAALCALERYGALMAEPSTADVTPSDDSHNGNGNYTTQGFVKPHSKKSNVELYADILKAHGRPMHATAIAEVAPQYGVVWAGTGDPDRMVRNGISRSKRFENQGDNVWWLAGVPVPRDTSADPGVGSVDSAMESTGRHLD